MFSIFVAAHILFHFCIMNSFWKHCTLPCSTMDSSWNGNKTAGFHICLYCKESSSVSISFGQFRFLCEGKYRPLSIIWLLFMSLSPKLQILIH